MILWAVLLHLANHNPMSIVSGLLLLYPTTPPNFSVLYAKVLFLLTNVQFSTVHNVSSPETHGQSLSLTSSPDDDKEIDQLSKTLITCSLNIRLPLHFVYNLIKLFLMWPVESKPAAFRHML